MIPASELGISAASYFAAQLPDLKKSSGRAMVRCCFHDERSGSLQVDLDSGRFKCFGCGAGGDIVDFHGKLHGLDFKKAKEELGGKALSTVRVSSLPPVSRAQSETIRVERARQIWIAAKPIESDDPVDLYLKSRGIFLDVYPDSLRFHSGLEYRDDDTGEVTGRYPAMVARIDKPDGEPTAVHRTYLTAEGSKANVPRPKKVIGPVNNGAIRLCSTDRRLAVAEGVETALSYHALTRLPVWACVSAGCMQKMELPGYVDDVFICTDIDANGTGEKAAMKLAESLIQAGKQARIAKPPSGKDWNDYLRDYQTK